MLRYSIPLVLSLTALTGCGDSGTVAAEPSDGSTDADSVATDTKELDDARPPTCGAPFVDTQWGTALDDEVLDLAVDAAGAIYAVGYSGGKLGVANDGPTGDAKGLVRQFLRGSSGFVTVIDTGASTVVDAAATRWDGTVHFAGRTRGAIAGATNKGAFDLLVGSIDQLGAVRTLAQSGTAAPDHAMRLVIDDAGRLTIGGYADIHTAGGAVLAWDDSFVHALTLEGAAPARPIWSWTAQTDGVDRIRGVARAADGRTFAVGEVETGAERGAVILELAADSTLLRRVTFSAGPLESIAGVKFAPDGDLIIAGSTARKLGAAHYGGQDAFVAKLDPVRFEARWIAQRGRAGSERVLDVAVAPSGAIVAVGEMFGNGTSSGDTRGESDAFALAVNADGKPQWMWQGAAAGVDGFNSVVIDACGDVIAGGFAVGETSGGAHLGLRDAVVRKLPRLE